MEKNTILAIVLSTIILAAGMGFNAWQMSKNPPPPPAVTSEDVQPVEAVADSTSDPAAETVSPDEADGTEAFAVQDYPVRTFTETTDLYSVTFSTEGGVVKEILLLNELDEGEPINMVLERDGNGGTFNIGFGGPEAAYVTDAFAHENLSSGGEIVHRFYRDFSKDGQVFTLSKTYRILPGEYVIELTVALETPDGRSIPLGGSNTDSYTLTYGPQIGPDFVKLDARNEIREFATYGATGNRGSFKREVYRPKNKDDGEIQVSETVEWGGVIGKYFGVMVDAGNNATFTFDSAEADGHDSPSRLQISRSFQNTANAENVYHFYIGPLRENNLEVYNDGAENAFGISDKYFDKAPRTSAALRWLEAILRVLLEVFYKVIPNYGVAIILLTVLIKVILYPFTHNSYESTSKMQAVQPKIAELKEQYKDDPQTLNAKTAELYKAEGVNPMGGCLPMLFQFPIFISLYQLLNKYFPLRGAAFIPGWINDLSSPEYVYQFENGITFFGNTYDAIRILPVLYLGGQLLMTKVTQAGSAGAQSGAQQKMLTLGMPIMFFFILYNMPSGLLLYWTAMNFITIGQQLVTNWVKKRNAIGGAA